MTLHRRTGLLGWLDRRGIIVRTASGRPLRDADFEALADEAERGYDISHLLDRKRGEPMQEPEVFRLVAARADDDDGGDFRLVVETANEEDIVLVVPDVETARELLSEVSRLRPWIAQRAGADDDRGAFSPRPNERKDKT